MFRRNDTDNMEPTKNQQEWHKYIIITKELACRVVNFNFAIEFESLRSRWLKRKYEGETNMKKIQINGIHVGQKNTVNVEIMKKIVKAMRILGKIYCSLERIFLAWVCRSN